MLAVHPDYVVVAFRVSEDGVFSLLNSYEGVRVFHKDHLDPRVTMGLSDPLPRFETLGECKEYLGSEPSDFRPCLLSYGEALRAWPRLPFADYVAPEA